MSCLRGLKEAYQKQRESRKMMVFLEDIPQHSIIVSLNCLGDTISLKKWLFRRLYKYAKIERGKGKHTSFFMSNKKDGI
jgi:hypothetical protein